MTLADTSLDERQQRARLWFETLRDNLTGAFERLEAELAATAPLAEQAPGHFVATPWTRADHSGAAGGGGLMSLLKGRVFEKAGIHTSTVFGEFAPEFRKQIPGAEHDPRFWASGLSLIAHPQNPHVPAAHLNTRFVVTSKWWFGGGADLTPALAARRTQADADTSACHGGVEEGCAAHRRADYARYKAGCGE